MARDAVLLTGFEPFLDVTLNPSGEVARALDGAELGAAGTGSTVTGRVLPVTFAGAPGALDAALDAVGAPPALVLCLGVHRGPSFRLETRAGARFESDQADNDGMRGAGLELDGPEWRTSPFDVPGRCAAALAEAGAAEVTVSDDAGGYLCERVYRAALDRADERGFPALFLHVPPVGFVGVEEQARVVLGFLARLLQGGAASA
ncbi:MAG: hypothetical protein AAFU73_13140 [Planctomycetota bacterium]